MYDETKQTIDKIKRENSILVEELAALVENSGVHESLDELVYDYFGEIGAKEANTHEDADAQERELLSSEDAATEVNNAGALEQICLILDGHGISDGERLIRDLIGKPGPRL